MIASLIMKHCINAFIITFFFTACSPNPKEPRGVRLASKPKKEEIQLPLPEPVVSNQMAVSDKNIVRFQLTKLAVVKEKFLKITDDIVFTGLKIKSSKDLAKIQLNIKSHCLTDQQQVVIKNFNRPLTPSIPIIELLPEEILLSSSIPSCSFSFKAQHSSGAVHFFELPQLPILEHSENRFIKIIDSSKADNENTDTFLLVDKKDDYIINTGNKEAITSLNVKCTNFSDTIPIRPQQFIPFTAFSIHIDALPLEEKISPYQVCRILAYRKQTLVAASKIFQLVYPLAPSIEIEPPADTIDRDDFYTYVMGPRGTRTGNRKKPLILYSYYINNSHSYPVKLFIKKTPIPITLYGLYTATYSESVDKYESMGFYVPHNHNFTIGAVQTVKGAFKENKDENGLSLTLEPKSRIRIPIVSKNFKLCQKAVNTSISLTLKKMSPHWWGGILNYPDFKIQVLDTKEHPFNREKKILNTSANTVNLFTSLLEAPLQKEKNKTPTIKFKNKSLWFFKNSNCNIDTESDIWNNMDDFKEFLAKQPFIELYKNSSDSKKAPEIRWHTEDLVPDSLTKFKETYLSLTKHLNERIKHLEIEDSIISTDGLGSGGYATPRR